MFGATVGGILIVLLLAINDLGWLLLTLFSLSSTNKLRIITYRLPFSSRRLELSVF